MGLTNTVQRMIIDALKNARITSASPGHINEVIDASFTVTPNLDNDIGDILTENVVFSKFVKLNTEKVEKIEKNPMLKFSQEQVRNVADFATNPAGFMINNIFRRFAKGAGVVVLAVILFEAVKTIVDELFKPGRLLDVRFRESIDKQILIFMNRKEQRELDAGIRPFITTTIGGLRGSSLAGQISGNLYNPYKLPVNLLDRRRVSNNNIITQRPQMRQILDPKTYRLVSE